MMTERGMPAQIKAQLGKEEPAFKYQSQPTKFKSAFGSQDGSQILPKRHGYQGS
jgi:hypothetical protein